MGAGQGETGRAVVKHTRRPGSNWVARSALRRGRREARRYMVWHGTAERRSGVPGGDVATVAIRRVQCVIVVDVARRARGRSRRHVRAHQRESRDAVIKRSRIPAGRGMAVGAIDYGERRTGGRVDRVVGLLPGRKMASGIAAIGRSNLEGVVAADVAQGAGDRHVLVGQWESSRAVIELPVGPNGDGVAGSALSGGRRETRGNVIGHVTASRGGGIPIFDVAAVALRRV